MATRHEIIRNWFKAPITPIMSPDDAVENYHRQHPSKIFLRNLPPEATVLDIGAGDGGLSVFKRWPSPARPDLKIYAFSLEKGRLFDDFDGYALGDWNVSPPDFGGKKFDAIHCANFIEHIDDPGSMIDWAARNLSDVGRLYIEWPTDDSQFWPNLKELAELGFDCIIGNYFDDPTHKHLLPTTKFVRDRLETNDLALESSGTINMPLLADELLQHYRTTSDVVSLQLAYWLKTGWIQYIVAQPKRGQPAEPSKEDRERIRNSRPSDFAELAQKLRSLREKT